MGVILTRKTVFNFDVLGKPQQLRFLDDFVEEHGLQAGMKMYVERIPGDYALHLFVPPHPDATGFIPLQVMTIEAAHIQVSSDAEKEPAWEVHLASVDVSATYH